jgi:hypothetical protein
VAEDSRHIVDELRRNAVSALNASQRLRQLFLEIELHLPEDLHALRLR